MKTALDEYHEFIDGRDPEAGRTTAVTIRPRAYRRVPLRYVPSPASSTRTAGSSGSLLWIVTVCRTLPFPVGENTTSRAAVFPGSTASGKGAAREKGAPSPPSAEPAGAETTRLPRVQRWVPE
jgi:hypothetical protein